ncbi:hypothetical protein FAGKG844_960004 [Frankia sp. AgKG'84/4]
MLTDLRGPHRHALSGAMADGTMIALGPNAQARFSQRCVRLSVIICRGRALPCQLTKTSVAPVASARRAGAARSGGTSCRARPAVAVTRRRRERCWRSRSTHWTGWLRSRRYRSFPAGDFTPAEDTATTRDPGHSGPGYRSRVSDTCLGHGGRQPVMLPARSASRHDDIPGARRPSRPEPECMAAVALGDDQVLAGAGDREWIVPTGQSLTCAASA